MKSWDYPKYYLAVARAGSVSAAAKKLSVSHATVLRQIDQLEGELGIKLFKRLQGGYQLSEAGEKLLDKAILMQTVMQDFEQSIQKQSDKLTGVLRVTQTESDQLNIYDLYSRFSNQYPDITLEIDTSVSQRNLNQQEFDIAIRFTDTPHDLLVGHRLGSVEFGAYATAEYLNQFSDSPGIEDLGWIIQKRSVNNWGERGEDSAFAKLYRLMDKPRIVLQSDNYCAIESAILSGVGVGFISHLKASKHENLVPIQGHDFANRESVWVLTHRELIKTKKVKCFMEFITKNLRETLIQGSAGR